MDTLKDPRSGRTKGNIYHQLATFLKVSQLPSLGNIAILLVRSEARCRDYVLKLPTARNVIGKKVTGYGYLQPIAFFLFSLWASPYTAEGSLRIGLPDNYAPLSETSEGELQGYLVDLVEAISPHLDEDIELVADNWTDLEEHLQTGEIDALFGLYFSEQRSSIYSFGPEIFLNRVYFYFREDSGIASLAQSKGTRLAVSGENSYLRIYAEKIYPSIEWVVAPDLPGILELMATDQSIVGIFEEEALVDHLPRSSLPAKLIRTGAPQMERSLLPVALQSNADLMGDLSRAIEQVDHYQKIKLQLAWMPKYHGRNVPVSSTLSLSSTEKHFLQENPIVSIATEADNPPLSFLASDGTSQGIQHDILDLIEKRSGLVFEKSIIAQNSRTEYINTNDRVQLYSGNRGERNSTIGYFSLPLVLVADSNSSRPSNITAYKGLKVSICTGSSTQNNLARRYPDIEFIPVSQDSVGLEFLSKDQVQAHLGNYASCTYLVQRQYASSLRIVDTGPERQNLSFVSTDFEGSKDLLSILNKAIASISEEERNTIYDRWVTADVRDVIDFSQWWKPIGLLAFCLFLALLWRIQTLRLSKALVEANERLLLAKKAGAGGQFEWFPKLGRVTYSPEFFEILGYQPGDLDHSESTVSELTHPDDLRRSYPRQLICTRAGREYEHKMRMRRVDGNWAWIILRGVPTHFYDDGSVKRYIGVQMDVTDLQVAIEKQREQQEVAKNASKAKSEFLANMSHEIRTPMNAILGFSRLLKRDKTLSDQQREYTELINTSSEHLLTLLDSILDMAKIEARHLSLLQLNVDLPRLLEDVASIFRVRCSEHSLDFQSEISRDLPKRILGDSTKLRQIIFNLLVNAVKFTEEGKVSFKAWRKENELFIEIDDQGCGIAPEELTQLFEAFSQGQAGQEQSQGTGLGLTISREFSRLMGGDIEVRSELGIGSTFTVRLPFEEIEFDEPEIESIHIPYQTAASKTILIADDKQSNLQYLERFLSEVGFNIRQASDGASTIAQWKLYTPDLILLDIRMPKMNGYQVVEYIRKDRIFQQPKILALTASAFNEQKSRIMELGADQFMTKPFNEDALLQAIAELLDLPTNIAPTQSLQPETAAPESTSTPLTLTTKQKKELISACQGGFVEKIDSITKELQLTYPEAASEIHSHARNFDYETISDIALKADLSEPPSPSAPEANTLK